MKTISPRCPRGFTAGLNDWIGHGVILTPFLPTYLNDIHAMQFNDGKAPDARTQADTAQPQNPQRNVNTLNNSECKFIALPSAKNCKLPYRSS